MALITQIGPLVIAAIYEPSSVSVSGPGDANGGVPISASFALASRLDAEQLEELVNNPDRCTNDADGVLEYVQCSGALARYTGWWVISKCDIGYGKSQFRHPTAKAYVPVSLSGVFYGSQGRPVISATHRAIPNNYAIAGRALVAALYPSYSTSPPHFQRQVTAGAGIWFYDGAVKRLPLLAGASWFLPALTGIRPLLRDPAGVAHYGPRSVAGSASGWKLENGIVRLKLGTPTLTWIFEGWVAGAWTALGALEVDASPGSSGTWTFAGTQVTDDRVAVDLVHNNGWLIRVELRIGERGVRLQADSTLAIRWRNTDDSATPAATAAANYLEDTANLASGARRMIAFANTPTTVSTATFAITAGLAAPVFAGFRPEGATDYDVTAELASQFLYDRDEVLTLE